MGLKFVCGIINFLFLFLLFRVGVVDWWWGMWFLGNCGELYLRKDDKFVDLMFYVCVVGKKLWEIILRIDGSIVYCNLLVFFVVYIFCCCWVRLWLCRVRSLILVVIMCIVSVCFCWFWVDLYVFVLR